ncbi:MbcA/ParS/Xre antitoxin family protein [Boseaceae bacterium BT-24-1]|nr:MbcA/ParS/Xre antitoxin family protein [Boseaceae bacterium BT-24-1]
MTLLEERALIRAALRIFRNWKIDDAQACRILGELDVRQIQRWEVEDNESVSEAVLERMAIVLTIHASLRRLYREPERGYAWMQRPNVAFENSSPIALIATGGDEALLRIKFYLDAESEAW